MQLWEYDEMRHVLQQRSDCRFVDRDEFRRLLVSSKRLIRADETRCGVRGLLDPTSECTFLITEEELMDEPFASSRRSYGFD